MLSEVERSETSRNISLFKHHSKKNSYASPIFSNNVRFLQPRISLPAIDFHFAYIAKALASDVYDSSRCDYRFCKYSHYRNSVTNNFTFDLWIVSWIHESKTSMVDCVNTRHLDSDLTMYLPYRDEHARKIYF